MKKQEIIKCVEIRAVPYDNKTYTCTNNFAYRGIGSTVFPGHLTKRIM